MIHPDHVLFTDADKDRPEAICDGNYQVALAMCKVCRKAESELDEPCTPRNEPTNEKRETSI